MDSWWSWVLLATGVTTFHLAGKKIWWAWYINIACQFLWFTYAIVTQQWGFIAGAFFYSAVFIRNAYLWTKEHREKIQRLDAIINTPMSPMEEACFRFHGNEPCKPGENHPDAAQSHHEVGDLEL